MHDNWDLEEINDDDDDAEDVEDMITITKLNWLH